MDSIDITKEQRRNERKSLRRLLLRLLIGVVLSILIVTLLSLSVVCLAVFVGNLSFRSPISLHSRCRIVSSSVDLRTSKICELGLLNYKAKNVFYPMEQKRYRCHYDYYWASVFKVEYIDHSGEVKFALAEAPNEALPYKCRPTFGAAWLTKDRFKVNETYDCWYTLDISKVNINDEGLFNCRAEDPSTTEMLKRYSIMFTRMLKSQTFSWGSISLWRWDLLAGLVAGFITALLSTALIAVARPLISVIHEFFASWMSTRYPNTILLKRACLAALYVAFMSWITVQYLKRLGLSPWGYSD